MQWLADYAGIWAERDWSRPRIARLFTEDAIYRPNVLPTIEPAYHGHDGITAYLDRTVPTLTWDEMIPGDVIDAGDRLVVQSWLTGTVEGQATTEILCTILRFAPDGRCAESRDFPVIGQGQIAPFEGWSAAADG